MNPAREIDRNCDEFEAAWQAGQIPNVEDFVVKIDKGHRPELLAALMPLDLTYRGKLGETVDSGGVNEVKNAGSGFEVTIDSDVGAEPVAEVAQTLDSGNLAKSPQATDRIKYFGEYELLSEIARGGMGVVYKARQVKLNRIVALKMILSGNLAGSEEVKRFQTEAEAAANLDHPGIVPIYEIGEHNGQHYFSMGFVEGQSLQRKLAAGPLPAKEAARLTRKIAEAVAYAHDKGVIHRDLKPANVLLDVNGEPKVTDFGLAKKVDADSGLTRTGSIMGTPSYMPPEQATGQTDKIGAAADIYSLGAILYALLTGRPPFQAANVVDTLKQVIENEPVTPRTLDSKIPLDLETICLKCLEKNIAGRYTSTQELVDELNRFDRGEPIHARRIGRTARTARWCKRNPVVSAFLALTSVMLLIVGASLWSESRQRKLAQEQTSFAERQTALAEKQTESLRRTNYAAQISRAFNLLDESPEEVDQILTNPELCPANLVDISWRLIDELNTGSSPVEIVVPGASGDWAFSGDGSLLSLVIDQRLLQIDLVTGETNYFPAMNHEVRIEPRTDFVASSHSGSLCIRPWSPVTRDQGERRTGLPLEILRTNWQKGAWLFDYAPTDSQEPTPASIQAACFSKDDSHIAIATGSAVQVWAMKPDIENHQDQSELFQRVSTHSIKPDILGEPTQVWFLPNRSAILLADAEKRFAVVPIQEDGSFADAVALLFQGECLALGDDSTRILIRDLDSQIVVESLDTETTGKAMVVGDQNTLNGTFLAGSDRVVMVSQRGQIKETDLNSGDSLDRSLLDDWSNSINKIAFSPDSTCVVAEGSDGIVRIWSRGGGKPHIQHRLKSIVPVAISADSSVLAIGDADGTIHFENYLQRFVHNNDSPPVSVEVKLPQSYATRIAFSPVDRQVAVTTGEGDLFIFEQPISADDVPVFRQINDSPIRFAAWALFFTNDGQEIGVTVDSRDDTVDTGYWSVSGAGPVPHEIEQGRVDYCCKGNEQVFVGHCDVPKSEQNSVTICDYYGKDHTFGIDYHNVRVIGSGHGPLTSVQVTADRRTLVTATSGGTLRFWDTHSGEQRLRLNQREANRRMQVPESNATESIHSFAIAENQGSLAIGYADGTVHLWPARDSSLRIRHTGNQQASYRHFFFGLGGAFYNQPPFHLTDDADLIIPERGKFFRLVDGETFELKSEFPEDGSSRFETTTSEQKENASTKEERLRQPTVWSPDFLFGVSILDDAMELWKPSALEPYMVIKYTDETDRLSKLPPCYANDSSAFVCVRDQGHGELVVYDSHGTELGAASVPDPLTPDDSEYERELGGIAVSSNGKFLAFETVKPKSYRKMEAVWLAKVGSSESPSQVPLPNIQENNQQTCFWSLLGFVRDNTCLAFANRKGALQIWDIEQARFVGDSIQVASLIPTLYPLTHVTSISPDGSRLAFETPVGLSVIATHPLAMIHHVACALPDSANHRIESADHLRIAAAFSPDGSKLAWHRDFRHYHSVNSGGSGGERWSSNTLDGIEILHLESVAKQWQPSILLKPTKAFSSDCLSPRLVSRMGRVSWGTASLVESGKVLNVFNGHFYTFALSPENHSRVVKMDLDQNGSFIPDARNGVALFVNNWEGDGPIASIYDVRSGKRKLEIQDDSLNQLAKKRSPGIRSSLRVEAAISKDGKYVVTGVWHSPSTFSSDWTPETKPEIFNVDWPIIVWDAESGEKLRQLGTTNFGVGVDFFGDRNQVFVREPRQLRMFDVETGDELKRWDDRAYRGHHPTLPWVALSRRSSHNGRPRMFGIEVVNLETDTPVSMLSFSGRALSFAMRAGNTQAHAGTYFSSDDVVFLNRDEMFGDGALDYGWGVYTPAKTTPIASSCFSDGSAISADNKFVISLETRDHRLVKPNDISDEGLESLLADGFQPRAPYLKIHSVATDTEVGRIYLFENGEWLVIDTQGRFDTSSKTTLKDVGWWNGNEIVLLDDVMQEYEQHGLLSILFGKSDKPLRNVIRPDGTVFQTWSKELPALRKVELDSLLAVPSGHDNLLSQIDVEKDGISGKWKFAGGKLDSVEKDSGIEFYYTPPDEYRMTAIVEPLDEPASLRLKQRIASHPFLVDLADDHGNSLESVDGDRNGSAIPNPTSNRSQVFRKGRAAEVVVTVRQNDVKVSVDGEQIIDFTGDSSRLSLNQIRSDARPIGIFTSGCRYRIHRLSIEAIRGAGLFYSVDTTKPEKPSSNDPSGDPKGMAPPLPDLEDLFGDPLGDSFGTPAITPRPSLAALKAAKLVPDGSIDLLKTLKIDDAWKRGQWKHDEESLEAVEKESVIELPYSPPDEFRMTALVEPLDDPAALLLRQQMDGHPFLVTLAYNGQNSLELVDGVNVPNESTHRSHLFRKGELSEIVVTVKKGVVQVSVDGKQIIDWNGDASRLSLNHHTPNLEALAVHVGGCRYRFHRLSIEPLTGHGQVLPVKGEVESEDLFGDPPPN